MPRLMPVNISSSSNNRRKSKFKGTTAEVGLRKENPQQKIHEYMNRQDIRIAKEIEPPSC